MADRHEKFERARPDGVVVLVDRNLDTGEQEVSVKDAPKSGPVTKTVPKQSDAKSDATSK